MSMHGADAEQREQSAGVRVIAILAVLTIIEYIAAIAIGASVPLLVVLTPIALVKAWYILKDFMHLPRLWADEEEAA